MQRNIDSFFKKVSPHGTSEALLGVQKKRKARVISSDEEEIAASPQVKKPREAKSLSANNRQPFENREPKASKLPVHKTSPKKELKKVDPTLAFGGEIQRVESKRKPKPKPMLLDDLDDGFDESLMEIGVDEYNENSKNNTSITGENKHSNKPNITAEVKRTPPKKKESKVRCSPNKNESIKLPVKEKTPKKESEEKNEELEMQNAKSTPRNRKGHTDLESSVLSDEERFERKRMSAVLYQKYKNRSSVLNHGCKEVPKGRTNCLAGLTFLVTGVLESLERDEAASIIKEYGGKMMSTVGKRLQYLVVGEDAGPKKLAQAEEFGTTVLTEDGLFDLIRAKSADSSNTTNGLAKSEKKEKKAGISADEIKIKKEKTPNKYKDDKPKSSSPNARNVKEEFTNIHNLVKQELPNNGGKVGSKETYQPAATLQINDHVMAWVDKYKPASVKDIVGQHGVSSNVTKLMNWLSKWYINHDGKKKLQKPNPWAKNDDGSFYKAALLSGPPGIGKTTTATLVCRELGFDAVEFNASDTRSKRLLKEEVSELLSNKSLYGYCHGSAQAVTKKHVLIMDEVDGMAGNEDRGGIQELIGLIKESSIPIICMCNDRNHQKMRSLVNYCYDLRFNKPRMEQIKARIMSICFKENIKLDGAKIEEIIAATNNDIRQSINHVSLLSAGKQLNLKSDKVTDKTASKDLKMGPWEAVRKVFSVDEHKNMSFNDKSDLFFHDYSLAPLFVQQNYLQVSPSGPKSDILQKIARTADALSLGDLVDKRIRSNAAWSLLPTQAVFSSVMPGEYMSGHFTGQINFPGWLGKNSRSNKRNRLAQEIHDHTRTCTSGSRLSIRMDYAPFILASIARPLKERGMDGVNDALKVIKDYHLLREDLESLIELTMWPGKKNPMDAVDGRVKAALTRTYNKEVLAYTYSANAGMKKKKTENADDAEILGIEGGDGEVVSVDSDNDDGDDTVENDGLIKKKANSGAGKSSVAKTKTASKKIATGGDKVKASRGKK